MSMFRSGTHSTSNAKTFTVLLTQAVCLSVSAGKTEAWTADTSSPGLSFFHIGVDIGCLASQRYTHCQRGTHGCMHAAAPHKPESVFFRVNKYAGF